MSNHIKVKHRETISGTELTKEWKETTATKQNDKNLQDVAIAYDARLAHAVKEIADTYGDTVYVKPKSLLKFGRSNQVSNTTRTTLMELPSGVFNETYATGNTIDTISSSDPGDTQLVTIEGHTVSGGNYTFVTQNATLNGQNKVTLTTPLARSTRMFNADSTNFAGDIYTYEDTAISGGVPTDGTKVHLICRGTEGRNQSFKASTTISSQDYWIITQMGGGVEQKASAFVDIELEVRQNGFVFRERYNFDVATDAGEFVINLDPCLIIPKNSDVRLRGLSSAAGTKVTGFMNGYLALIES